MVTTTDTQQAQANDSFDGLDVTLQATLPNFATESFEIDVDITTSGVAPKVNLALVIDTSGSTRLSSGSDVDGDGDNDTFLEAQQVAAKAFFQNLIDAGYPPEDVTVTLVEYNTRADLLGEFTLDQQSLFESEVDDLRSSDATNFERGLKEVIEAWDDRNNDSDPDNDVDSGSTNAVVFLSDGERNGGGDGADERDELLEDFGARITAIGVGENSSLSDLNVIDNTPGGNSAQKVVDAANLADVISAPPPLPELERIEFVVDSNEDGVADTTVVVDRNDVELVETPLGFRIECIKIEGYPFNLGEDLEVSVRAVFNNGADLLTVGNIIIPQTVCFVTGTRILTPEGSVNIEDITPGTRVVTRDHGVQKVAWVGASRVTAAMMKAKPELRPIRIMPNAFGRQQPSRNLYLSRQHRVLVRDWRAEMMCGAAEGVLVPAGALVNDKKVTVDFSRTEGVTYYHLACDAHEVVYADGLECETFHPSAQNIAGMSAEARDEFLTLFPEMAAEDAGIPAARAALPMSTGRTLS